jgi:preprotein translocase subunit SecG
MSQNPQNNNQNFTPPNIPQDGFNPPGQATPVTNGGQVTFGPSFDPVNNTNNNFQAGFADTTTTSNNTFTPAPNLDNNNYGGFEQNSQFNTFDPNQPQSAPFQSPDQGYQSPNQFQQNNYDPNSQANFNQTGFNNSTTDYQTQQYANYDANSYQPPVENYNANYSQTNPFDQTQQVNYNANTVTEYQNQPLNQNPGYDPNNPYQDPSFAYQQDPNQTYYDPNMGYQTTPNMNYDPNTYQPIDYNNAQVNAYDPNAIQNYNNQQEYYNSAELPENQAQIQNKSTFQEKKSGNNLFLIISGIVAVILLIATIVLFAILNQNRNNQEKNSTNNDTNNTTAEIVDPKQKKPEEEKPETKEEKPKEEKPAEDKPVKQFDPTKTPAENAKIREATELTSEWLLQNFSSNDVDTKGNCTNISVCGPTADPDSDGLNNLEEYMYDTDPLNPDTSGDGIADGDKVFVFEANPREKDSTGDGINDIDRLLACQDPITNDASRIPPNRLSKLASNIQLRPLQELTRNTFKNNGATAQDIQNGYIESKCNPITIEF